MKKSFIMYNDLKPMLDLLTNEQAGNLIKAVYEAQNNVEVRCLDQVTNIVFTSIKSCFARDEEKYINICNKRSNAGKKGGLAKANNAKQKRQKVANLPDSENDSENDSYKETLLTLPAEAVEVTDRIISHVRSLDGSRKSINGPNLHKTKLTWAQDVDKINRLDGRTWDEINNTLSFVIADDFWRGNILSGSKFRKKFSDLLIKSKKETNQTVNGTPQPQKTPESVLKGYA